MQKNNILQKWSELYNFLPQIEIDPIGKYKYILIALYPKTKKKKTVTNEEIFYFIRGYGDCSFHADISERFKNNIKVLNLKYINEENIEDDILNSLKIDVYGGGWIENIPSEKKIHIYGFSYKYGKANHNQTSDILKKKFTNIPDSNFLVDEQECD